MSKQLLCNGQLIEQQDAVSMYLNALLSDETTESAAPEYSDRLLEPNRQENDLCLEVESFKGSENELSNTEKCGNDIPEDRVPDYLNSGFQTLSFIVSNIKLCVPLKQLNGIIKWDGMVTRLPGQATWCTGVMRIRGQNVNIIDLYSVLHNMSNNISPHNRSKKHSLRYLLLVGNGQWGLACDSVDNISLLYKSDINWRNFAVRAFIMGTVIKPMSLMLNVDELVRCLENGLL